MWHDNVVDVGREATYRFVDLVVGELNNMYRRAGVPLATIHLGGDEVPKGAWEKSPACQRLEIGTNSPYSAAANWSFIFWIALRDSQASLHSAGLLGRLFVT